MSNRYLRQARQAQEIGMKWLGRLDELVPELAHCPQRQFSRLRRGEPSTTPSSATGCREHGDRRATSRDRADVSNMGNLHHDAANREPPLLVSIWRQHAIVAGSNQR
jgi:hypothetical protein